MAALVGSPGLWNENDLRTGHPASPHAAVDDIWLLFNRIPSDPADLIDDTRVQPYRAWWALAPLRNLVLDVARRVDGVALGRVVVTRLRPGARILPHVDEGAAAEHFTRFQIALQSLPGAMMRIGTEEIGFRTGDVWLIDNRAEHEVVNNSADDRVVCIVDVRIERC